MVGEIGLCADAECWAHPESLGLEDVDLASVPWLKTFTRGSELRAALSHACALEEIWVVSTEDVPVINLAAALRKDGFQGVICMVADESSGSALSRATAAGVSEVYSLERFIQRFSMEMNRRKRMDEVAAGVDVPGLRAVGAQPAAPLKSGNPRVGSSFEAPRRGAPPLRTGAGSLVAIMGASGGVGKSAVAACFAAAACAQGKRTLVLDADLQFGCMHRMFGVKQPVTFDDVAADEKVLERLAANTETGTPAILAAPLRLEHSETLSGRVGALASAATGLFDVVIADTGASWSDAHASLMEIATCTMFVIDQRSESVRACQHALELCRRMGLATGSFIFALNRCSKEASYTSADVSCAMDGAHIHELEDGGLEVEELCGSGMALALGSSGNAFAKSVQALASSVMPEVFGAGSKVAPKERSMAFRPFGHRRERQKRRQRKGNEIVVQAGPPHPEFRSTRHAWESL